MAWRRRVDITGIFVRRVLDVHHTVAISALAERKPEVVHAGLVQTSKGRPNRRTINGNPPCRTGGQFLVIGCILIVIGLQSLGMTNGNVADDSNSDVI